MMREALESLIRNVPDFPKPGIQFKDITPLLQNAEAMKSVVDEMARVAKPLGVEVVAGIESRGFLFGVPLAMALGLPFVPVRKPGKLPYETAGIEYELEYGTDRLELHTDAVAPGQRVIIVDDLLATGGTANATANLVRQVGGTPVGLMVLIELSFLGGAAKLGSLPVHAQLKY